MIFLIYQLYSEDDIEFEVLIDQWLQQQVPELQPSLTTWIESYLTPSKSSLINTRHSIWINLKFFESSASYFFKEKL